MLIYKNINGEEEAVSKRMIVRFSRNEDLTTNRRKSITIIHLVNNEHLKTLDELEALLKQMNDIQNPNIRKVKKCQKNP